MSVIQNISGELRDQKLSLRWEIYSDPIALLLQLGRDNEFKKKVSFLLPVTTGCDLDIEKGGWFVRIGVFTGTTTSGTIEWSGIYGPFEGGSLVSRVAKKEYPIVYTRSLENGVRLHTGHMGPMYAILEYTNSLTTKTIYTFDTGEGFFNCTGLVHEFTSIQNINYPLAAASMTYNIRMTTFDKFPKDAILMLSDGTAVYNKQPMRPITRHNSTDYASGKAETAILKDLAESKKMKFSDYRQYTAYLAAKAKTSGSLEHI